MLPAMMQGESANAAMYCAVLGLERNGLRQTDFSQKRVCTKAPQAMLHLIEFSHCTGSALNAAQVGVIRVKERIVAASMHAPCDSYRHLAIGECNVHPQGLSRNVDACVAQQFEKVYIGSCSRKCADIAWLR